MKKFKKKDRLPLAIAILDLIGVKYLVFAIKTLIQDKYPDLRGLIKTDCIDQTSIDMLENEHTEFGTVTIASITAITDTVDFIENQCNVYGEAWTDTKMKHLEFAKELYLSIVKDDFPRDDERDGFGNPVAPGHFDNYAKSMVPVIYSLCTLLIDGEMDYDLEWENDPTYLSFLYQDYSGYKYAIPLQRLQALGFVLNVNYFTLNRLISRNKNTDMVDD